MFDFISSSQNLSIRSPSSERGNVLFVILLAVALLGALTAAIQGSNTSETANIDNETLALRIGSVQRSASEVERGVNFLINNAISEADIRFAHPNNNADYGDLAADTTPENQMFHRDGGAARFPEVPRGINDGSAWEFFASTAAPNVGSSRADLLMVLPNVTQQFCDAVNNANDQTDSQPEDSGSGAASGSSPGGCVLAGDAARFDDGQQFYTTTNTMDNSSFTNLPARQACVQCSGISGSPLHYYYVVMSR